MRIKRRVWTRIIETVKATHWKDFLDQANSRTVWQTTPFLDRQNNYANIPPFREGDSETTDNHDKVRLLMDTFFPVIELPPPETIVPPQELPWEPLTEAEIAKTLNNARKRT